jgi:ketosteroid isomerase-like protein
MSERDDTAVAERFYALWAEGGIAGLRPIITDDVEWQPHPQAPEPGPFHGPDEVIRVATSYTRGFGRYRPVPHAIHPGSVEGEVLGLATYTTVGREGGQEFTVPVGHLLTIRDGKVARFEEIPDLVEALAAVGIDPGENPPTRTGGIAQTLITAIEDGDAALAAALVARGAEVDAPCGPADWVGLRVADAEVLGRRDEALVIATIGPRDRSAEGRRVAVRIDSDPLGLISRLTVSEDVDAARREFKGLGRRPEPG